MARWSAVRAILECTSALVACEVGVTLDVIEHPKLLLGSRRIVVAPKEPEATITVLVDESVHIDGVRIEHLKHRSRMVATV
jgi:hypothetical protein